jgi:hypothetical protein
VRQCVGVKRACKRRRNDLIDLMIDSLTSEAAVENEKAIMTLTFMSRLLLMKRNIIKFQMPRQPDTVKYIP